MPTPSDERMARFKAAINKCRDGNLSAMFGLEISSTELVTINALAKASGDAFAYLLTQRLLRSMTIGK